MNLNIDDKNGEENVDSFDVVDDDVNHPGHYQSDTDKIEVIDVIEAFKLNFNLGNVIKYVLRAGKKGENVQMEMLKDLSKALWYLNREVDLYDRKK